MDIGVILREAIKPEFLLGSQVLIGFHTGGTLGFGTVIGYEIRYDKETQSTDIRYVIDRDGDTIIVNPHNKYGFNLSSEDKPTEPIEVQMKYTGSVSAKDERIVKRLEL